jgi:hypothetical protein
MASNYRTISPSPIPIIMRYKDIVPSNFDNCGNKIHFKKILSILSEKPVKCYLSRRKGEEISCIVPLPGYEGQVEFVCSYDMVKHTYEILQNKRKLTIYQDILNLPSEKYSLEQLCNFRFLSSREPYNDFTSLYEMQKIRSAVSSLQICDETLAEDQREIWTKYIDAQKQLVSELQKPYFCIGEPRLSEIPSNNGHGIFRYILELDLQYEKYDEYRQIESVLSEKLSIEEKFDNDGTIYLTYKNIFRGLDLVIEKEFSDVVERERMIGCNLKVRPIQTSSIIQAEVGDIMTIEQDRYILRVSNLSITDERAAEIMAGYGYAPSSKGVLYSISNMDNLYKSSHVEKYGIRFTEKGSINKKNVTDREKKEIILPEPESANTFRFERKWDNATKESLEMTHHMLCWLYGESNISVERYLNFVKEDNETNVYGFTEESWSDIQRDLYMLDFPITEGDADKFKNLYFEFRDAEDLLEKYNAIVNIGKFELVKSPEDDDFKFKVKTNIISKKTIKQIFKERIDKLSGAEFVCTIPGENGREVLQPLGQLHAYDTTMSKMALHIPNYTEEDQKKSKNILRFLNSNPTIKAVKANLRGDEAKIEWLQQAMDKLKAGEKWEPNTRPVNPNIKDFIFDSSKAAPTQLFMDISIQDLQEFRQFDSSSILSLNESQKEAVLHALNAQDLCLLQGPPGTGKTTVIAELIWQHIKRNQRSRVLLTSETNLAVDNALEKLMNEKNENPVMARYATIIKPIRFGRMEKFEEEGLQYSIERIHQWMGASEEQIEEVIENEVLDETNDDTELMDDADEADPSNNVVQKWMNRIAARAKNQDPKYADVMKEWTLGLVMPDQATKQLFADSYLNHVNVIGSTCSSTGSPVFANEFYRVFKHLTRRQSLSLNKLITALGQSVPNLRNIDYLSSTLDMILDPNDLGFENLKKRICSMGTIEFDAVIMDEASKATPPELLLPLCFGKKSIIIGDHKQLPPMLNEFSFKEALLNLGSEKAKLLAEDIDRNFVETSQFKRLITNAAVSPTIRSTFNIQYRMHPYINDVISQFYMDNGQTGLRCGLDENRVDSPDLGDPQSRYHGLTYRGFITPKIHTIWVNVVAPEKTDGTSKVNDVEIEAINSVLYLLKNSQGFDEYMSYWDGVKNFGEKEVGVISFYGRQVRQIRERVRPVAKKVGIPVRLNTVDKFQGMERNIVIVSTVRSDISDAGNGTMRKNHDAGFARSPERLNVALSRARRLLIVIGNKEFFSKIKDSNNNPLYLNAINQIAKNGNVIDYSKLMQLAQYEQE